MEPIDRPFRFTWDFGVVWGLLTFTIYFLARGWYLGPWYSEVAFFIVAPFIATFFIYGPVLFVRQIIGSGSRGWFVARVFLSTVLVVALFFAILYVSSHGKHISSMWGGVVGFMAIAYLHRRLKQ